MNAEPLVLHRVDAGIDHLILNRPEQGNAVSLAFCEALVEAIDRLSLNKPRVVLISARGPRFCAGGDIGEFVENRERLPAHIGAMLAMLNPAMARLAALPAPVISVVHGSVGGAGLALACCADFVLASHTARVRGGYSAIGLTPDIGASWHVSRRIGATRAKHLFLLNQTLDAEQCLAMGLFDQLHEPQALTEAAQQLAQTLAGGATQAFARIKRLCDQADSQEITTHLELECSALLASTHSNDAREGVQAFIEKRSPSFIGN